jgi:hypothetical protein
MGDGSGPDGLAKKDGAKALSGAESGDTATTQVGKPSRTKNLITEYQVFFETWLRMCKNIGQAGRPVVLFGAGVGVPANLESCVERRYFSTLHYLALTCEDEVLVERLRQRPSWRQTHSPDYQFEHVRFNQWFKAQASQSVPAIELIDTTGVSEWDTAERVAAWIRVRI